MANFQLTQTGAQVQADLNKVEGIAEIKTIGSGLTLSSSGELSSSGGGGSSIGGGATLIVSSDLPISCIVLGTSAGVFGWHIFTNVTSVHMFNAICIAFTGGDMHDFSGSPSNIRDVNGTALGSTLTLYKLYYFADDTASITFTD